MVLRNMPLMALLACATVPPTAEPSGAPIALVAVIDGPAPADAKQRTNTADHLASQIRCRGHRVLTVASAPVAAQRSEQARLDKLRALAPQAPWLAHHSRYFYA